MPINVPTKRPDTKSVPIEIAVVVSEAPDYYQPGKKLNMYIERPTADMISQTITDHSLYPADEVLCKAPFRAYVEKDTDIEIIAMSASAHKSLGGDKINEWTRTFGGKAAWVEGELRPYDMALEQQAGEEPRVLQGVCFTILAVRSQPKAKMDATVKPKAKTGTKNGKVIPRF